MGAGAFTGSMRITKKDPATGDVIWTQRYWATFGQVSRGWGEGVILWQENWGEIDWPIDWSEEQFEGDFTIDAVQAGFALPFSPEEEEEEGEEEDEPSPEEEALGQDRDEWGGITYGIAGTIRFLGDRTFLPMVGDETGLGRIEGLYYGVEAGTAAGVLVRFNHEVQSPIDADEILAVLGSVVELEDAAEDIALFDVDEATITTDGWPLLARLCADHRAALETPWAFLRLIGHASTTADGAVNLPLSKDRAEATYQAMRALLGPAFAVHEANTFIGHRGEYDALQFLPDDTEDATWRRVDIWLDSSLLVGI